MNFLFWNIKGRTVNTAGAPLLDVLQQIIEAESIDLIALAEYREYSDLLEATLVKNNKFVRLKKLSSKIEKVDVFFDPQKIEVDIAQNNELSTALRIKSKETGISINGFFCHLPKLPPCMFCHGQDQFRPQFRKRFQQHLLVEHIPEELFYNPLRCYIHRGGE